MSAKSAFVARSADARSNPPISSQGTGGGGGTPFDKDGGGGGIPGQAGGGGGTPFVAGGA